MNKKHEDLNNDEEHLPLYRAEDISRSEDQREGDEVAHEDPSQQHVGQLSATGSDHWGRTVADPHTADKTVGDKNNISHSER